MSTTLVLAKALALPIGFALGAGLTLGALQYTDIIPEQPVQQEQVQPPAEGSPADLISKYGCWTGEAPASQQGKVPGHAVVTYPGHVAPTYGGPAAVDAALGHVFDGTHPHLTVHAFCE